VKVLDYFLHQREEWVKIGVFGQINHIKISLSLFIIITEDKYVHN